MAERERDCSIKREHFDCESFHKATQLTQLNGVLFLVQNGQNFMSELSDKQSAILELVSAEGEQEQSIAQTYKVKIQLLERHKSGGRYNFQTIGPDRLKDIQLQLNGAIGDSLKFDAIFKESTQTQIEMVISTNNQQKGKDIMIMSKTKMYSPAIAYKWQSHNSYIVRAEKRTENRNEIYIETDKEIEGVGFSGKSLLTIYQRFTDEIEFLSNTIFEVKCGKRVSRSPDSSRIPYILTPRVQKKFFKSINSEENGCQMLIGKQIFVLFKKDNRKRFMKVQIKRDQQKELRSIINYVDRDRQQQSQSYSSDGTLLSQDINQVHQEFNYEPFYSPQSQVLDSNVYNQEIQQPDSQRFSLQSGLFQPYQHSSDIDTWDQ